MKTPPSPPPLSLSRPRTVQRTGDHFEQQPSNWQETIGRAPPVTRAARFGRRESPLTLFSSIDESVSPAATADTFESFSLEKRPTCSGCGSSWVRPFLDLGRNSSYLCLISIARFAVWITARSTVASSGFKRESRAPSLMNGGKSEECFIEGFSGFFGTQTSELLTHLSRDCIFLSRVARMCEQVRGGQCGQV